MPLTIGESIKAIREEKGNSQKGPNLDNNRIKNPTIQELQQIGAALHLWNKDKETTKAFCGNRNCTCNEPAPTYMERGPFVHTWVAKCRDGEHRELGIRSYAFVPTYNEDGDLNRYCPYCGEELISECRNCGRKVRSGDHANCGGCGHYLWLTYAVDDVISGDIPRLNGDCESVDESLPF